MAVQELQNERLTRGGLGFAGGIVLAATALVLQLGLLHFLEKKNT